MNYIRRFCRNKENLLKEKKDTLTVFEKSKTRTFWKRREVRTRNFNYFFSIILRLLKTDSTERETDRYRNIHNSNEKRLNIKE